MTYHHDDTIRGRERKRGVHDMLDQRQSAGLMEHFGLSGFHSGAETGRQDNYCQIRVHLVFVFVFEARWRRLRPSPARWIATSAMAAGSCRIFLPNEANGRAMT